VLGLIFLEFADNKYRQHEKAILEEYSKLKDTRREKPMSERHREMRLLLVQDWYKDSQTRKVVRSAVEEVLDLKLPGSYGRVLLRKKCDNVFEKLLDYASHGRKWAA
jgi:hypothetical protein